MVGNGDAGEALHAHDAVRVIDTAREGMSLPIIDGKGSARAVLWPGNGARFRSLHLIDIGAGSSTLTLTHENDCVYYVIAGAGVVVDVSSGAAQPLVEGAMVHIDAGDSYRLEGATDGMRLVGGPCPPDAAFYALAQGRATAKNEA